MRGPDKAGGSLFGPVGLEERIPARRPLRKIRQVVDDAPARLDGGLALLCAGSGRPSLAPEGVTGAGPIRILFSIGRNAS